MLIGCFDARDGFQWLNHLGVLGAYVYALLDFRTDVYWLCRMPVVAGIVVWDIEGDLHWSMRVILSAIKMFVNCMDCDWKCSLDSMSERVNLIMIPNIYFTHSAEAHNHRHMLSCWM